MNQVLSRLAADAGIADPRHESLRLAFGFACASRVQHLLEDPRAVSCLAVLQAFVGGEAGRPALTEAAQQMAAVANNHRGSNSIDGSAHAAVSATYAVANALAGRALEAASYAAYASVYAYGGYAVTDPSAFEDEFAWQVDRFKQLWGGLQAASAAPGFRPMLASDLAMLHDWLCRAHVARWWGASPSYAEVENGYLPMVAPESTTRGYIAMLAREPVGFFQSYVVMGSGGGWWEDERDPGARGIDQFLANAQQLGRGLGSALVRAFVDRLLADPAVTQVQTDPSPDNERAIRCYMKAGFVARAQVVTPDGPALLMLRTRGPVLPSP